MTRANKDSRLNDPRFLAAFDLIKNTGAREIRIGHTDEDDGDPVVWYVCGTWGMHTQTGKPMAKGGRLVHEAAAALNPIKAMMRFCEQVIDGGQCLHCDKPTIFVDDTDTELLDQMGGCVYAWDPELRVFRRGCEGDDR